MEKCMIKNTILNDGEIQLLRERFVIDYAKNHGWDPFKLNEDQLLEIKSQKGYQNPGLILS